MRKIIQLINDKVLDAFFPRRCAICDGVISGKDIVCDKCREGVELICGDTCMKCGKSLKNQHEVYCYDCKRSVKAFERGFAVFEYEYIKESLYRFKYSGRAEYSRFYAQMTMVRYGDRFISLGIEAFIPVPVHMLRLRKRGYNQAYEYAKELSRLSNIPVDNELITRQTNTIPLKRLRPEERQKKLKNAFKLLRNDVKFKKVCVVDDIYTTGSTINTISVLLKSLGIEEVFFITIAIGQGI